MTYIPYTVTKGVATKEITCITGKGAPATETAGAIGLFYMDENNGAVYKCIAAQDGAYTWVLFTSGAAEETDALYYPTLSAAVADINAGTTDNTTSKANAKVEVFHSETGRLLVKLVDNVSEDSVITVGKSLDLILNGKVLTLSSINSGMIFADGTECVIDGQVAGSTIKSEGVVTDGTYVCLTVNSKTMKFNGGTYDFSVDIYSTNLALKVSELCELFEAVECKFHVKNDRATQAGQSKPTRWFQTQAAKALLRKCEAVVEADVVEGIRASGPCILDDTTITGVAKSYGIGVSATGGAVYVDGGALACTASNGTAYGADVPTAGSVIYLNGTTLQGIRIGADNSATAYIDGCVFDAVGLPAGCMTSNVGQHNNTLYISNCKKTEGTGAFSVATLNDDGASDSGHRIKVGHGNEFAATDFPSSEGLGWSWVENTDELYRKKHPDAELNGTDFEVLSQIVPIRSSYYANLSSAINDINSGTTFSAIKRSDAAAEVFRSETGRLCVKLLGDVVENSVISVEKDIDLILNGKTLTLDSSSAGMVFAEGTDCTIDGRVVGSQFNIENVSSEGEATVVGVTVNSKRMTLLEGDYTCNVNVYNTYLMFKVTTLCEQFNAIKCTFDLKNSRASQPSTAVMRWLQDQAANTLIDKCTITIEGDRLECFKAADGVHVFRDTVTTGVAQSFVHGLALAGGTLYVEGGEIALAASSGSAENVIVQKQDSVAYINDAIIGNVRVSCSNAEVYIDGCTIDAPGLPAVHLASTSSQGNSALYISNSKKTEETSAFIVDTLGGDGTTDSGHRIKIGCGNEFAASDLPSSDGLGWSWVENTDELYRKKLSGVPLTGKDFELLSDIAKPKGVVYATLVGSSTNETAWTAAGDYWVQDLSVPGATASSVWWMQADLGDSKALNDQYENDLNKIAKAKAGMPGVGFVRVWAKCTIANDIPVVLKEV